MNRTKNAIIDAFWLLLEEKPYNKITVKDIVERCTSRKKAILHIYRSVFREYFINELDRIALYIVEQYMDTVFIGQSLPLEDKALLTRFYKCVFTGIFIDWLNDGMQYDLSHHIARIDTLFDGAAELAYRISIQSASKQR